MLTLDLETARRFILGKQGLWPGRRWQGAAGTAGAMREMEYLQLDPLQIVARSHDIALSSRVVDYVPGLWEESTYGERQFFDWGGWLATRPMEELPYWRVIMHRERGGAADCDPGIHRMGREHAPVVEEMRGVLRERGTVSNRDFQMAARTRTQSYRGRKDSALALYYLWRTGDVMTHHRENFERVYALAENVAPVHLLHEHDDTTTDRFLLKKEIAFSGLSRLNRTGDAFLRGVPFSKKKALLDQLLADGEVIEVRVEGWKAVHYALGQDAPLLNDVAGGRVPAPWQPIDTTTTEEVTFLAPLDQVSARGRAKVVFGFNYVWEVYKPAEKRQFGYYTLPVLWGDQLVARFDSQLDSTSSTYTVLGLWLEDDALSTNEAFAEALGRGFARFVKFLGAQQINVQAINEPLLHQRILSLASQER